MYHDVFGYEGWANDGMAIYTGWLKGRCGAQGEKPQGGSSGGYDLHGVEVGRIGVSMKCVVRWGLYPLILCEPFC